MVSKKEKRNDGVYIRIQMPNKQGNQRGSRVVQPSTRSINHGIVDKKKKDKEKPTIPFQKSIGRRISANLTLKMDK